MSTETQPSLSWLRKIPGELIQLDEKPLLGFPPAFPWDKFSSEIQSTLKAEGISITPGEIQWRTEKDLFSGIGEKPKSLSLTVAPLTGGVWWVMPEKGVKLFIHLLTSKQAGGPVEDVIDEDFMNAFFQFLAIEAISAFEKVGPDKKLSVTINNNALPNEPCLGIDVTMTIKNETTYGRLLLSAPFRKAYAQRYAQQQQKLALESPLADSLEVMIHLEAGKIDLKPSEWKQLAIGDFVLLDSCSLDPADEDKGRVMLIINGAPCFRAKIKQGSLKILEHPLYHEVDKSMSTPPTTPQPPKGDKGPAKEDDLFDDDEDDKAEGHDDIKDEDFEIEDDIEKSANPKAPPAPAAAAKTPAPAAAGAPAAAPAAPAATGATAPQAPGSTTPLSVEEIPLPVVIEVGRIQMSVKKLLELQPGNMLELNIHPESGVDMVVNGKRIARGELLRIGDAYGLRITELS